VSAGDGIDEVVVGVGDDDVGLEAAAAAATVVWLRRCDMRSSLEENLRPQKSDPLIQLQTKDDAPPMAVEDVAGDRLLVDDDDVVVDVVGAEENMDDGDGNPNIAAVVTGG
jgi:hypothetical protein